MKKGVNVNTRIRSKSKAMYYRDPAAPKTWDYMVPKKGERNVKGKHCKFVRCEVCTERECCDGEKIEITPKPFVCRIVLKKGK